MAKIKKKKKMALEFRETFTCFTSFREASQSSLRFAYAQKKIPQEKRLYLRCRHLFVDRHLSDE